MTDTPGDAGHPPAPRLFRLTTFTMFAVGAAVAVTVLLHLVLVGHFAEKQGQRDAELRVQQLSWQMRDSLNRVVATAVADVQLLAELPQVRSFADADASRGALESLQRSFPDYAWIGIADREGMVVAATGRMLEGVNARERPWFAAGSQGLRATDYHPAQLLNKMLPKAADPWRFVDVAAPLRDEAGTVRGVVGVHMSWAWARSRARELFTPALREYGAEVLVVRADGTVLLGPPELLEKRIDLPSLRLAQRGETGAIREQGPDGKTYITGYSRTGTAGDPATLQWVVLVRHTEEAAMAGARQLERRMIVLSVLMAASLAGCAALLARRLTRPMDALSRAIEGAAQAGERAGQSVGQCSDIPVVNGFHEVQVLSRAMRELVRSEQGHRLALETMNQQLESTVAARTAELQALLRCDMLTGLPNRRALMEMLPKAQQRAARSGQYCALLFLDLDGFKGVNDTHGHEQGDELLRQFSARLAAALRKTDTAARLGGDEFVVVLEGMNDAGDARDKAERLLPLLGAPYALARATVTVGVSIGVALHMPDDSHDSERWMARADAAMYVAKRGGKGTVALAPEATRAG